MISCLLSSNGAIREGGVELLQAWREQKGSTLWVDLQDESPADENRLLIDELGLDRYAVTEAQRPRHPPGFEAFPQHFYLLLKPLTADSNDLDFETLQLAVFVAPGLLVTRHNKYSRFLENLHQKMLSESDSDLDPLALVLAITNRVASRYGRILLDLERRLDEIEDALFETRTDKLMQELVGYNTALRKMRRILAYHTNAFTQLRDHFDPADADDWYDEFDNVLGLMERFHSLSELYQNVIDDLIDGYISLNAHRLNQIMKVLTIVTVIFVPLTLLVGIYGMNFENIPELRSRNGYFILLAVMGAIATTLLLLFKRVRWL